LGASCEPQSQAHEKGRGRAPPDPRAAKVPANVTLQTLGTPERSRNLCKRVPKSDRVVPNALPAWPVVQRTECGGYAKGAAPHMAEATCGMRTGEGSLAHKRPVVYCCSTSVRDMGGFVISTECLTISADHGSNS